MFDHTATKLQAFLHFGAFFFERVPLLGACEVTLAETHISRRQGSLWGFLSYLRLGVADLLFAACCQDNVTLQMCI